MRTLFLFSMLALALGCGDDDRGPSEMPLGDGGTSDDFDGDGISNEDEGLAEQIDTDGDGTWDAYDLDSDDDGLPDAFERGPGTSPVDSDGDGTPDFRDLDSDDNGIPDAREGMGDADGDGIPDHADLDDDDDRVSDFIELDGRTEFPADADDDGYPDFRDADSDNDFILDGQERGPELTQPDTDGDGMPDWRDTDTDGDGYPDAVEAGDELLETPPVDTDEDGIPDFRDLDSDNDGLPDALEREFGTDRLRGDTDGDGVSDLIEVGAGTDPLDDTVSPRTRGDFVFVMPYLEPAEPARDTLLFRTNLQFADVYFLFDTTGSMSGEIAAMKDAIQLVITNLACEDFGTACTGDLECDEGQVCSATGTCVADPRVSGCIASLYTGVGTYEGNPNSYRNLLALQGNPLETQRRIPASASGGGGSESLFESVACVADPTACRNAECAMTGVGCAGFRDDARRILITITDEDNQCTSCSPVNTAAGAASRLLAEDITFVGVDASSNGAPEDDLTAIARMSNSFDGAGSPLLAQGDGVAVTRVVTESVREIAQNVRLFASVDVENVDGDDGDALQFIDRIEVNTSGEGECTAVAGGVDTNGDSFPDAFPSLLPGTPVCWDVVALDNEVVRPIARPQVFVARVVVRGDGSILDTRRVFFLVPPEVDRPVFE